MPRTDLISSSAKRAALALAVITPVCLFAASVIAGETVHGKQQWLVVAAILPLLPGFYPAAVLVNPWMDSIGDFVATAVLGVAFNFIIYLAVIFLAQWIWGALRPQGTD